MAHESGTHRDPKLEFVRRNQDLTTIPAKVMVLSDIEFLDLSHNQIEIVPKGLFPTIPTLKHVDLSNNCIRMLPDDISDLMNLEILNIASNKIADLPQGILGVSSLKELHMAHNQIEELAGSWAGMENLQVLDVEGNRLRSVPADIGWLPLKQLNVSDNPDLHIPAHVMKRGFRAVMCYLQVVGEQHALVEHHMGSFTALLAELQRSHMLHMGEDLDKDNALRLKLAERTGLLSYARAGIHELEDEHVAELAGLQVADLQRNHLKELPAGLRALSRLVVLNCAFNFMQQLPQGVEDLVLPKLAVLNLSFNRLAALPEHLATQMPHLQQLYLASNCLTSLPEGLAALNVADLFLSENAFRVVPAVVCAMTGLQKLSLAACQLATLPEEVGELACLRFLDVSFNELKALPKGVERLQALTTMNISFNPLGHFPAVLGGLRQLIELNADFTGITTFPPEIGGLSLLEGLQVEGCALVAPFDTLYKKDPLLIVAMHNLQLLALDLSEAGLEEFPMQLGRLTGLKSLNLGKNAIHDLPPFLGSMTQLTSLTLKGNPLKQPLARIAEARGDLALVGFMRLDGTALDLCECGFEALPLEVLEQPRPNLAQLKLVNNRLADLPQALTQLSNLSMLALDNNLLRHIPSVVLKLPKLTILMVSGNLLTYLPEALGNCTQLQALIMHSNQLMQLPDSLTQLTNLRALACTSNRFFQLPKTLGALSALRLLDVSYNLVASLPRSIGQLSKLKSLKATHNQLKSLPAELLGLPALQELHLSHNPIEVPMEMNANSAAAAKRLTAALQEYLSAHPEALGMDREYAAAAAADGNMATSRGSLDGWPGDGTHRHSAHASFAPSAAPTARTLTASKGGEATAAIDRHISFSKPGKEGANKAARSSKHIVFHADSAEAARSAASSPAPPESGDSHVRFSAPSQADSGESHARFAANTAESADNHARFAVLCAGQTEDSAESHARFAATAESADNHAHFATLCAAPDGEPADSQVLISASKAAGDTGKDNSSHVGPETLEMVPEVSHIERKYDNLLASLARRGSHGNDDDDGADDAEDGAAQHNMAEHAADGSSNGDAPAAAAVPQAAPEPSAAPAPATAQADKAPEQPPVKAEAPAQQPADTPQTGAAAHTAHDEALAHWHAAKEDMEQAGLLAKHDASSAGAAESTAKATDKKAANTSTAPTDPVRAAVAKSNWDTIPIADVGKLLVALAHAPPPPVARPRPGSAAATRRANTAAMESGAGGMDAISETSSGTEEAAGAGAAGGAAAVGGIASLRRPQTKARFQRVMHQTAAAMALLEKHAAANGRPRVGGATVPPGALAPPPTVAATSKAPMPQVKS